MRRYASCTPAPLRWGCSVRAAQLLWLFKVTISRITQEKFLWQLIQESQYVGYKQMDIRLGKGEGTVSEPTRMLASQVDTCCPTYCLSD